MVSLVLFLALYKSVFAQSELTFEDAWKKASVHSSDIVRSALALEQTQLDRKLANYDNDPRLNITATAQRTVPDPSNGAKEQNYSAGVYVNLYDFGRTSSKRSQLDFLSQIKNLNQDEVRDQLYFKLARSFVSFVALKRIEALVKNQIDVAKLKLNQQQSNYKQGLRPESDVVAAQAELGRVTIAWQRAHDDVTTAYVQIIGLMDPAQNVSLQSVPQPRSGFMQRSPKEMLELVKNWSQFLPTSSQKRRETEIAALEADRDLISATKRPTLTGNVSQVRSGEFRESPRELKSSIVGQIQLSWDIPWNFMSRVEERKVALKQQDLNEQEKIEMQTRSLKDTQASSVIEQSVALWELLNGQTMHLSRQQQLTKNRYQSGKASAFELARTVRLFRQRAHNSQSIHQPSFSLQLFCRRVSYRRVF